MLSVQDEKLEEKTIIEKTAITLKQFEILSNIPKIPLKILN